MVEHSPKILAREEKATTTTYDLVFRPEMTFTVDRAVNTCTKNQSSPRLAFRCQKDPKVSAPFSRNLGYSSNASPSLDMSRRQSDC